MHNVCRIAWVARGDAHARRRCQRQNPSKTGLATNSSGQVPGSGAKTNVYSAVVVLVKIPLARTFSESEKPTYWPVPPVKTTVPVALSSGTTMKSMDEVATPNTSSPLKVEVIVN